LTVINIDKDIAHEKQLHNMADALEISRDHIAYANDGFFIPGKNDGPLKSIDVRDDGLYGFIVETETRQKWSAVEKKLTGFGMKLS
jgi:hypothetical protein